MSRRKGKDGLTPDEQALWDHAAATMKPLRKAKPRVIDGADEAAFEPVAVKVRSRPKVHDAPAMPGTKASSRATVIPERASPARAPDLAAFDRKSARRIRAGRIEIEARIDLHGMRQDEAHGALVRFLRSAASKGARWVLVITGKGAPQRRGWHEDDSVSDGGGWLDGRVEARGVLRRNVPRWLSEPELRLLVVSYTQASAAHGGEGAIYIQLRRRDR